MRYLIIILLTFLTSINIGVSATYTTAQAGAYNNINTWVGGAVPTSIDDVVIAHNVSVPFNTTVANVTINSGGILRSSVASTNLTMTGNLTINAGGEFRGVDITNNLNLIFSGTSIYTNAGTASFKNITVNSTRSLTLASSISSGLLNTSTINVNGTLNCQTNTIDLDLLSTFNLNSGATLQTAVTNGVQATITGLGTENYSTTANYTFSTGCTNTGFGSIVEVNNITLDAVTITNTTSFAMNGGFQRNATPNNFNANGLSTTITLKGNSSSSSLSGYSISVDYLKVEGTHSAFGTLGIYQILEIDPGASLTVSGGRDFNLESGATVISNGTFSPWNFVPSSNCIGTGTINAGYCHNLSGYKHNSGTFSLTGPNSLTEGSATFSNLAITGNSTFNSTNPTNIYIVDDFIISNSIVSSLTNVTMESGNIYGGGTIDIGGILINGNTTLTSTNMTVDDVTLNTGTFDIISNQLRVDDDIINNGGFIDATDANSTFWYAGADADKTIPANTFVGNTIGNFTLTKGGRITLSNNLLVSIALSGNNTNLILDLQNYNLTLNGSISFANGQVDLTDDNSTLTLNSNGAITLPQFVSNECGNLTLNRNGTVTSFANLRVNNTLTLNNASLIFDIQSYTLTLDNPIVSTSGALDLTDNNSTINFAFTGATTFSNGAFLSGQVGNMTLSGSSTITLGSNADLDGALTLNNANAFFDISTYRLRLGGNLNYTSGYIDATDLSSTLSFAGSSPITFDANALFNGGEVGNLELIHSSTISQQNILQILNDLYVNNSNLYYDLQANFLALKGDLIYTAGVLDFTDANNTFVLAETDAFTFEDGIFLNNTFGNLHLERSNLITLNADITVLSTLKLDNSNLDLDLQTNGASLTLYNEINNIDPTNTKILVESAGTIVYSGTSALPLDGNDFNNNSIYNLTVNNSNTLTLQDFLYVKNTLTMTASSPTINIVDNDFILQGNVSYTSGYIDATNDSGQFTVEGTSAFTMPSYFINNEVSNLQLQRVGTITQNGPMTIDQNMFLNNASTIYDLNSNTLTIENTFTPTAGKINAEDNGSAFVIANGVTTTAYSGNSFENNTINELYVYNGVTLNDNFVIEDLVKIENGNANFQGTNVEIQGDVTLDNSGGIQTALTNSMTFSNTSNMTNSSNGSIFLNNIFATGTLNCRASPNITGNLSVSGVGNFSSGTVTFLNSASKSITNTGTLDFNYLNIGSGSDVRTTSNFDINNDFRMADNTSVFVASSPSTISFTKDGLNIYATTNSDGSNAGLVLYNFSCVTGYTTNFKGAYDFYVNGDISANNSYVNFDANSTLILTDATGNSNFGVYTLDNLTFKSTANYNWSCHSNISGTVTVEAGGQTYMFLNYFNNTTDATLVNQAPNTSSNLQMYEITITNSVLTTDDSFRLNNWISIDASSTLSQTSGTFTKGGGAITNNGEMTINEFEIVGTPTTSSDILINGNYYLQNSGHSFIASAGSITFTKSDLNIENAGTTQFYDLYIDGAVTNGTTDDDFTIAGDLELGTTSYFTASSPSEITFSGNGVITCPSFATGSTGLFLNDLSVSGNYTTNSPTSEIIIMQVNGNLSVTGSLDFNINAATRFTGTGKTITNSGSLNFEYFWLSTGSYSTNSNFTVNDKFLINTGTSFTANAGEITFNGNSTTFGNNASNDLYDLKFNDINISNESFASGSFTIAGDLTVNSSSSFTHSTGEIRFVDGGTHTIYNSDQLIFNDFSIENGNLVQTSSDFTVKSDQFDLLGTTSSFTALDGEVSFVVNSSSATITSGGGLGSVIFHDLLIDDAKSLYIQEDLDIIIEGDFTAGLSANMYTYGTTNFYLQGSTQQTISIDNGSEINFQHFTLNNSTGLKLNNSISVDELNVYQDIRLNAGDIDLFGENVFTMQEPLAYLYETNGIFKNTIDDDSQLGHIYYDYTFNSTLNNIDFAGLGIGFRQGIGASVFGQTIIKRYHTSLDVAGGTSVQRLFAVTTANSGIKSRPVFSYFDSELNSQEEENLILASTRTKDDLWAAIDTKNQYRINRLEALDTIDQYTDFNTLWTAVVPLRVSLSELEERVNQDDYPNSRLIAGTSDHLILLLQVSATDYTDITELKLFVPDNQRQFENFKLYYSQDEFFNSENDNELLSTQSIGQDSVIFSNLVGIEISPTQPINFFITADIADSVTIFADSVLVYINQSCITISQGIIDLETVGDVYYKFQQRIDAIFNPIGLEENPLIPNSLDNVIYGFEIQPLGNEAGFSGFEFYFENTPELSLAGQLHLYRSVDNDFGTSEDNTKLSLFDAVNITTDNLYSFDLINEQILEEEGRYYFIVADSISNYANDGTKDMIMGIPHQSLRSSRAAPVETDTVYGNNYTFSDLDVIIDNTNYISDGNIFKDGRKQNLFGFTIETENRAKFSKLILQYTTTGGLSPSNHFTNIKLWQDLNNNKVADAGEEISTASIDAPYFVFENFITSVEFNGSRNFLITADIRNSTPNNSKITLTIPNEDYVIFNKPATVQSGGPFEGPTRTIITANAPSSISISDIYPNFIQSGDRIDVTIKILDANGNPTIADQRYDISLNAIGDVTKSGNSSSPFIKGEGHVTISGYILTSNDGESPVYIVANNSDLGSANSNTFTIFPPGPTSNSSNLTLSVGDPNTTSINIDSWTNGSGDGRIIVARLGRTPASPTNGTNYTAETDATQSLITSNQTSPGSFVIYNGSDNSIPFSFDGLMSGANYFFKIFEYKLFNGQPIYLLNDENPTYSFTTASSSDPYTSNQDSSAAITIYEDIVIDGNLGSNEEEDWYKFTKTNDNILINSCGEFLFIDLFKINPSNNRLQLIRRTQNTGRNCQIIILNENVGETFYIKVHRLNGVSSSDYQFKVRSFNYELFSRPDCDCP